MSRLNSGLRVLTLRCEAASELSSRELDDLLPCLDRAALLCHLLACRSCRRFRVQVRLIRKAVRRREQLLAEMGSTEGGLSRKHDTASPSRAERLAAMMPAPRPCSNSGDIGICRLHGQEPFPVRYF